MCDADIIIKCQITIYYSTVLYKLQSEIILKLYNLKNS